MSRATIKRAPPVEPQSVMSQARAFLSRSLLRLALAGRVRWSIVLPFRERIGGGL